MKRLWLLAAVIAAMLTGLVTSGMTAEAELPSVYIGGGETVLHIPPLTEETCPYDTDAEGACIKVVCPEGSPRIDGQGACIQPNDPIEVDGVSTPVEGTPVATYSTVRYGACVATTVVSTKKLPSWIEIRGLSIALRPPSTVKPNKSAEFHYKLVGERTVYVEHHRQPGLTGPRDAEWCSLEPRVPLAYKLRAPARAYVNSHSDSTPIPAAEAHLSSTPIRSAQVSRPSCYVVVTSHARSGKACQNCPYQRTSDSVSMTACMTPRDLYQSGFVNAVPDPTVPGAIDSAISDYVNGRQCRPDENRPDSPAQAGESNSCLQSEGWTLHE